MITFPRVGVVVAARDAGAYLADTLRSVVGQTFADWVCVVVDDGSSDDTAAIARAFAADDARFRVVVQQHRGTPVARNVGIAALGEGVGLLTFLDADDLWLPDSLAVLVAELVEHPDAVGAYGLAEYMDADGRPLFPGRHPARQRERRAMGRFDLVDVPAAEPYTFESLIVSGTLWPTAVALHRRAVVDAVGGFDPSLRQVQDWDLYLRMSRQGSFVPVDRQVAWYRQHPANVTKRSDRVAFYSLQVRRKAFDSGDDTPGQHVISRRVWRRLVARWTVWSLQAALTGVRGRHPADTVAALRAAATFLRATVRGRPAAPTVQLADTIARFVSARAIDPRSTSRRVADPAV